MISFEIQRFGDGLKAWEITRVEDRGDDEYGSQLVVADRWLMERGYHSPPTEDEIAHMMQREDMVAVKLTRFVDGTVALLVLE